MAAPLIALAVAIVFAGVLTAGMSNPPAPPVPPSVPAPTVTAAEAVRLRFLPEWTSAAVPLPGAEDDIARSAFSDRFALSPAADPAPPSGPMTAYAPVPPSWPTVPAGPEPGRGRPTNALLNDAQIASIKQRLKLTKEQERLWPAVETALRAVVWRRGTDKRKPAAATLDTRTVEQLKAAAAPLMAKLREDQKREVRALSHVMGIGDLASQF